MDLGCYPLNMIRTLCGDEPTVSSAEAIIGTTGVDLSIQATLAFASGVEGLIDCAMPETGELQGELIIEGELGRLHASKPILPHLGGVLHIESPQGQREEKADSQSTFFYQLQALAHTLKGESTPIPDMQDSIANAAALDAIRNAANI
jgi:predicted dehydrogenase